ncbi:MAG: Wzz/FepE/Etk N-terminal domain-containing protein [Gallionella sp.]|nr:Wzz/FepE/Etk N-terminal domain-containing protein [Gallionella sp.]
MNEETRGDTVSVLELLNVIRRYKRLIFALPIIAAVFSALFVSYVLRPTWEASAILEVGRIGQTGQTGQTGQIPIEPVTNVVSRIQHPSFATGALSYANVKPDELKGVKVAYLGTLKVTPVKGAELIGVKLRAHSAVLAGNLIQGSIANLQKVHSEMMSITIDRHNKQIQILTKDIQDTNSEIELLRKKLLASHNWNAFDATLSANILQNKSAELRDMIQRKLLLEEQVSPSRTYTTRVVGDIHVSDEPVSPNKPLIIGLAMLLGLLGALVIAFVHNAITTSVPRINS